MQQQSCAKNEFKLLPYNLPNGMKDTGVVSVIKCSYNDLNWRSQWCPTETGHIIWITELMSYCVKSKVTSFIQGLCKGKRKIHNSFNEIDRWGVWHVWQPLGQRVAVETSTTPCTILYIRVRWAIALHSTKDCCHPVVLIMSVTLDSLL